MQELFLESVKLSLIGSMLALAVMLVRLLFRKAPKWIFCVLWGIVALRLICPLSIESTLSLVPDRLASGQIITSVGSDYIGDVDIIYESNAGYTNAVEAGRKPIYSNDGYYVVTEKNSLEAPKTIGEAVYPVLSWVWVAGMVGMLFYTAISYLILKRRMVEATLLRDNIWQCEQVDSPFVLGIIRPRIYLPYAITDADMENVIAHERSHICRRDHWWKPIGFLLLAIHWFNPVMWLAYILLCRDIEAACDEKVIKHMEKDEMRAYSTALLHCSVHRRRIAACPLAFGEVGVKERIRRVMKYKKPAFWLVVLAVTASVAACFLFLTDPAPKTVDGISFPFAVEDIDTVEMFHYNSGPENAEKKIITEKEDIHALYSQFSNLTFYEKSTKASSSVDVTSFRFRLSDGTAYELVYYCYGVKNGLLKSPTENFEYFTPADIGWNWSMLDPAYKAVPAEITELPGFGTGILTNPENSHTKTKLLSLVDEITDNPDCAASSNPYTYIEAKRAQYDEILSYGNSAVSCFLEQLRTGENGLRGYIMAAACSEITGIGVKVGEYSISWWSTAQEWLALYDESIQQGTPVAMTLDDVMELSRKGMALTWEDLKAFKGRDVGSGLFVIRYDIDSDFYLAVGDGKLTGTPMYAILCSMSGETHVDIREGDVQGFIETHRPSGLDCAISDFISEYYWDIRPDGMIHTQSYVLLGKEVASAIPVQGMDDPFEEVTVYLLVRARRYPIGTGTELLATGGELVPTMIRLWINSESYVQREYWTPGVKGDGSGDFSYDEVRKKFPENIAEEALNLDKYRARLDQMCDSKALAYLSKLENDSDRPLEEKYPEYFDLDAEKGLEVYVYQMAAKLYSCVLMSGRDGGYTWQELQGTPTTLEEMRRIVQSYRLDRSKISVIPILIPYSSYWYTIDDAYRAKIEGLFWAEYVDIPDFENSAVLDSISYDIDGDGKQEQCTISPGPTSGLFSFTLRAVPAEGADSGRQYSEVYVLGGAYKLSFEITSGVLRIRGDSMGSPERTVYFDIAVKDGHILLQCEEEGIFFE